MKFASTLAVLVAASSLAGFAVQAADRCIDVWAHDDNSDICAVDAGAGYWGWTNGRYGMSGCSGCSCPDCPMEAPTKAPVDPIPLPHQCVGIVGSWSGDPHMRTFDGLKYDCQGEGEFHVIKSMDSPFEVQGRFVKFRTGKRPTVTKSVVWVTGDGDPKIQVTAPDTPQNGSCMPSVTTKLDGEVKTPDLSQATFLENSNVQVQLEERDSKKYEGWIFYHHSSGLQVTVLAKKSSANGCVLSAKYCLPHTWDVSKENLVGLLGPPPDGNKWNDWMDRDNNPVDVPTNKRDLKFDKSYDYCVQNWCIRTVGESLFEYDSAADETFDGFNKCGLEADQETKGCALDPSDELANVCGTEDLACLVDGCTGGVEEAKSFLETESQLADGDCGKEVAFENFDGPSGEDWGEIEQGSRDTPFLALHQGSDSFERTFTNLPSAADQLKIEFFFLEMGDFEDLPGHQYDDEVTIKIGDTKLDLLGFDEAYIEGNREEYFEGFKNGISWNRRAVSEHHEDFGFGFDTDQLHKIVVTVPNSYFESGSMTVKFEVDMSASRNNEFGGVDDFKIIAYGLGCDIPDGDGGGDGIQHDQCCGEQIIFQDFEDNNANHWGSIKSQNSNHYLQLKKNTDPVHVYYDSFPAAADEAIIEFLLRKVGNWGNKCKNNNCEDFRLVATWNGVDIEFETWENEYSGGTRTTQGSANGVSWTKTEECMDSLKFVVRVPKSFLSGPMDLTLDYTTTKGGHGVGIDDFRVTLYSNSCPAPVARRRLIDSLRVPETRALTADVEADACECICPALSGENPAPGSGPSAPKVMDLYIGQDGVECAPVGTKVGTVTLVYNMDSTVTATYDIDPAYELKNTHLYIGDERLPGSESSNVLPIGQFPYTGTETTYTLDPLVCDFYVAAHAEVCGDFPTLEPTSSPTGSPTNGPTAGPTGATDAPTATPTAAPTFDSRNAPTPPAPTKAAPQPTPAEPQPTPAAPKPTPAAPKPTPAAAPTPGAFGDPHIMTFAGQEFDFHAACDSVLLDNPQFRDVGMRIHIRTKLHTWWSYVEVAAIQIGDDVLEVMGGDNFKFWVNGVEGSAETTDIIFSSLNLKVKFKRPTGHQLHVRLDLGHGDAMGIQTYKQYVKVTIPAKKANNYVNARGLMGSYPSGAWLGRDNSTVFDDANQFGMEWQVKADEPKLFHSLDAPQHPASCVFPSASEAKRRLTDSSITMDEAENACAHLVDSRAHADCVFDVLSTNDMSVAGAY